MLYEHTDSRAALLSIYSRTEIPKIPCDSTRHLFESGIECQRYFGDRPSGVVEQTNNTLQGEYL